MLWVEISLLNPEKHSDVVIDQLEDSYWYQIWKYLNGHELVRDAPLNTRLCWKG